MKNLLPTFSMRFAKKNRIAKHGSIRAGETRVFLHVRFFRVSATFLREPEEGMRRKMHAMQRGVGEPPPLFERRE